MSVVSYIYSGILGRHEEAVDILNFSLISNPGDRGLINNLAFALISVGRLDEARSLLNKVDAAATDDLSTITLVATEGLLLFRRGFFLEGRKLYLDAIDVAKRKSNRHYAAIGALHLAIEEIRADTETKLESFKNAVELASQSDEPGVRHVLARLKTMAKVAKLET